MHVLLRLLEDGEFHSGEALGRALGVSRAAVWKQLQQLESELGIELHKVRGKGYRLPPGIELLNRSDVDRGLAALGWSGHVYEYLDSTNLQAVRLLEQKLIAPFVVLSEQQTSGRGRRGRVWQSPFAQNLYFTLAVPITGGMRQVEALSLTVGLAVARSLQAQGLTGVGLKWPNDILLNGQKLAGILLELVGDPADLCHVIIGVGINVNMQLSAAGAIDQPWTSLREALGRWVGRTELSLSLAQTLKHYIELHWVSGFEGLRVEWEALHVWQGLSACLISGAQIIEGKVLGVASDGALRMLVDGAERSFSGGELSLRLKHDS